MASFEHTSLILAFLFLGRLSYRKIIFKRKEPRNIDAKFYTRYNIFRDIKVNLLKLSRPVTL